MLDLESKVMDLLKTEYGIEERIEAALDAEIARQVMLWISRHNLVSEINDAIELALCDSNITDAIKQAIESFVEDAVG